MSEHGLMESAFKNNPYVKLSADRTIFFSEDVTKKSANELSSLLLHYDHINNEEITIYINTSGGDLYAITNIYDVMQIIKSPIRTVVIGRAYSAGSILLATGSKGRRCAFKNSLVMIHGIQFKFPLLGENIKRSEDYINFIDDKNNELLKILAKHSGKTFEKIVEDCMRDVYLTSQEALEYGLIDVIL